MTRATSGPFSTAEIVGTASTATPAVEVDLFSSSSIQFSIQNLNGKNYWAQTIKLVIDGNGKLGHLTSNWDFIIQILRYIKKAAAQGLPYEDKGNSQFGFSDVDWTVSPINRRSIFV